MGSRKLGVQEAELKRGLERAELAEKNLKGIEEELETVGENMKNLEKAAEKALEREEKLVEKILSLQNKYKTTEARFEYGEMNITKLNQDRRHRGRDLQGEADDQEVFRRAGRHLRRHDPKLLNRPCQKLVTQSSNDDALKHERPCLKSFP